MKTALNKNNMKIIAPITLCIFVLFACKSEEFISSPQEHGALDSVKIVASKMSFPCQESFIEFDPENPKFEKVWFDYDSARYLYALKEEIFKTKEEARKYYRIGEGVAHEVYNNKQRSIFELRQITFNIAKTEVKIDYLMSQLKNREEFKQELEKNDFLIERVKSTLKTNIDNISVKFSAKKVCDVYYINYSSDAEKGNELMCRSLFQIAKDNEIEILKNDPVKYQQFLDLLVDVSEIIQAREDYKMFAKSQEGFTERINQLVHNIEDLKRLKNNEQAPSIINELDSIRTLEQSIINDLLNDNNCPVSSIEAFLKYYYASMGREYFGPKQHEKNIYQDRVTKALYNRYVECDNN